MEELEKRKLPRQLQTVPETGARRANVMFSPLRPLNTYLDSAGVRMGGRCFGGGGCGVPKAAPDSSEGAK